MKKSLSIIMLLAALCQTLMLPALAKRTPVPHVVPVTDAAVTYTAPNKDGTTGDVEARDMKTHKLLWRVVVYRVKINPRMEEDVQWRFITRLQIACGNLLVTNESGRRYEVNLQTRQVKRVALGQKIERTADA